MIAGGIILFSIATSDILGGGGGKEIKRMDDIGIVPLGTPLIVGPAVLTTELILAEVYGILATVIVVTINLILGGLILYTCNFWERLIGRAGSRGLSKIISLLLAAIAVMMIRKGFFALLKMEF